MFTGIVQAVGLIDTAAPHGDDIILVIDAKALDLSDVSSGDSIAVNGACLTVVEHDFKSFQVHVSAETLRCTAGLNAQGKVNLEKALRLSDKLDGHLVSGHVDDTGEVTALEPKGDCVGMWIQAPHALMRYVAVKGSITVSGVSLTVNSVTQDKFCFNLIPHTLENTTLGDLKPGDPVNLEVDLIARYVDRAQAWEKE
ncbi:MAG TPA: riboflavin synthase [Methylophilaceae bacterium]|jgi:riboflavin synthase